MIADCAYGDCESQTVSAGNFYGVSSRKLEKYLDEFVYRYNRPFWEPLLPERLLNICALRLPTPAKILYTEDLLT